MKKILIFCALGLFVIGCAEVTGLSEVYFSPSIPANFPPIPIPEDNPLTEAKIELGRHLFYDTRLSRDSTVACGTCHRQEFAFADFGKRFSDGVREELTVRNSPSLTNVAYNNFLFWEGGVPSLELQAIAPILAHNEMDMNTDTLVLRIIDDPIYKDLFQRAYGSQEVTINKIIKAITSFERTLLSSLSPFDEFVRGNISAVSASALRGMELFFNEEGDCFHCHNGFNFNDNNFHNTALDSAITDEGRYLITGNVLDKAKFKTPTLRNVELTSPYMHNGSLATLEDVVRHYNSGGKNNPYADILMRPLNLTEQDIADLVAFLRSLTDRKFTTDPALSNPWK